MICGLFKWSEEREQPSGLLWLPYGTYSVDRFLLFEGKYITSHR